MLQIRLRIKYFIPTYSKYSNASSTLKFDEKQGLTEGSNTIILTSGYILTKLHMTESSETVYRISRTKTT